MMYSLFCSRRLSRKGSGLIEVLVTVLIIAIGVTATLHMFVTSSRNSKNSYYRLQAQFYIDDLFNRMRGNQLGINNGHYLFSQGEGSSCGTVASIPDPIGNLEGQQVATKDLKAWGKSIAERFSNAYCKVERDASGAKQYTVTLGWTENGTVPNLLECNELDKATFCFSITSLICTNFEVAGSSYTCS